MINNLLKFDVCILGAGITGLTCAVTLLQKGLKVVLLEKENTISNASNNNAGQIVPGFAIDEPSLLALTSQNYCQRLWSLTYKGIETIKRTLLANQFPVELKKNSYMYLTNHENVNQLLIQWEKYRSLYNPEKKMQYISGDKVNSQLCTNYFVGGLKETDCYVMDSSLYLQNLVTNVRKLGGVIKYSIPNLNLSYLKRNSNNVKIRINHHKSVLARYLVIATNGQLNYSTPLNFMNAYLFRTAPVAHIDLIPNYAFSILSSKNYLHYCRYLEDKSFLFCCKSLPFNYTSRELIKLFSREMLAIFPYLKGINIRQFSSSIIALTKTRFPEIGKISEYVYYAQGYSGRGLVLGTLFGKIIADAILGNTEDFNCFLNMNNSQGGTDERLLFTHSS